MTGFHASGGLTADQWVSAIGMIMVLTLIGGNLIRRGTRMSPAGWLALAWMALLWAAIIATAALAFRHFRPDGF